jgi:hypothetical protein
MSDYFNETEYIVNTDTKSNDNDNDEILENYNYIDIDDKYYTKTKSTKKMIGYVKKQD